MNKHFLFTVISILMFSNSFAQFKKGDFEFSLTGALSSMTAENSITSSSTYYSSSNSNSETRTTAGISFSPAYYIFDNISIEAEIGLSAVEKMQPSQYMLLNLSYTYLFPETKTALFAHAGYGLSNSVAISYMNNSISRASDKFDVKVVNLGAGIKYLISPNVILHSELNYRIHSWTYEYSDNYNISSDYKISNLSMLIGFSILI